MSAVTHLNQGNFPLHNSVTVYVVFDPSLC